ncbi:MAG: hypothetical protein RLZZ502_1172 [Pseudomonadota bacterium]|jgi:uncharacterized membrane protein
MNTPVTIDQTPTPDKSVVYITYALYALAMFTAFPALVAVIINYIKRGSETNAMLRSHHTWHIRTFWWTMFWSVLGWLTVWLLGLGFLILGIVWVWVLYRLVKGFIYLSDNKAMY